MPFPKNRINWPKKAKKRNVGKSPLASLLNAISRRHPLWGKRKVAKEAANQIRKGQK